MTETLNRLASAETQAETPAETPDDVVASTRPWGRFDLFALNRTTSVKIITVDPGRRLSLQRHEHRGEFWQVLSGTADIQVGDDRWAAATDERIWVPCGALHRIGNSTAEPVRILEIAYGEFDECDIERLEDDFSR